MNEDFKKRFGSCKISWKIENFCFACRPDNYIIFSPEFTLQGMNFAKWKMSLELEYDHQLGCSQVSFYLEKWNISKPKNIGVNWLVSLKAGNEEFGPYENNSEFDKHCKHGQIDITITDKILENLSPLKPDTIFINVYFIAFDKESLLEPNKQLARGLFLLSEDFKQLKGMKESYTDVKLQVKDKYIEAHKAVLIRNAVFEAYVKDAKNDVIEISNFDYKILDDFVNFLYSGDVEYLLSSPSISMIKCMEHFNCDAVKSYYIPEEVIMHSKMKVETHEFQWIVADNLSLNNFTVTSPPIKRLNVNTVWKLTISLQSNDLSEFISIFAEITDGDRPSYFCLEFAVINEVGEKYFPRRLIRNNKCYDNMGVKDFVMKDLLFYKPFSTANDGTNIFFKVRTSDGSHENSMGCHKVSFVSSIEAQTYKQLSAGMSDLLKSEKYSDIALKCKDKIIKAHKCILVSRFLGFRRMIDSPSFDNNTLYFTDIEPDILEIIVNYIYTSILGDLTGSQALVLFDVSSKKQLHIPSLHEESLRILRDKHAYITDIDNVIVRNK